MALETLTTSDPPPPPVEAEKSLVVWVVVLTAAVVATGMAYTLWWPAVVRHHGFYWLTPGDAWSQVRIAHFVGWGGLSFVYLRLTALITLPGFNVLLAPVVMISSKLGLSEIAPGLPGPPKPSSWLLIGPAMLLCSAVTLFGIDALAKRLELSVGQRRVLAVVVAAAVWSSIAIWGHPEDAIAIGLSAWALVRVRDGRFVSAAWIVGIAVSMQLWALLLVPLFLGLVGARRMVVFLVRAAIPPAFLAVAVLVPDFHHSFRMLTQQPSYPTVDHATPWIALSPVLAKGVVAAGPARIGGFVVAALIGWFVARRRENLLQVTWALAVVLAARCIFEAVMVPYYVMPVVVVGCLLALRLGRTRFALAVMASAGVTVLTFYRLGDWTYFLGMSGLLVAILVLSAPMLSRKAIRWEPSKHAPADPSTLMASGNLLPTGAVMGYASVGVPGDRPT